MELFWFFVQQFKVPILGLLIFGSLLLIRIYILPMRRTAPPRPGESGPEQQKQSGK